MVIIHLQGIYNQSTMVLPLETTNGTTALIIFCKGNQLRKAISWQHKKYSSTGMHQLIIPWYFEIYHDTEMHV